MNIPPIPVTTFLDRTCGACTKPDREVYCSRCKIIYYCNTECQKRDWPDHKILCETAINSILQPKTRQFDPPNCLKGNVEIITASLSSKPFQYFAIKENHSLYGLHFWSDCARVLGEKVGVDVKKQVSKNSSKKFLIDPSLFVASLSHHIKDLETDLKKRSIPNYETHLKSIEAILHEEFSENHFWIDNSSQHTFERSWNIFNMMMPLCGYVHSTKIDLKYSPMTLAFPTEVEKDFQRKEAFFLMTGAAVKTNPFEYVFLKTNRMNELRLWYRLRQNYRVEAFYALGYRAVLTPQEGDFVGYFVSKENPMLTYLGIWREPDLVESKPGHCIAPVFRLHPLDFSDTHGRNIVFLRKSSHKIN